MAVEDESIENSLRMESYERMIKSFVNLHLLKVRKSIQDGDKIEKGIHEKGGLLIGDVQVENFSGQFLVSKITIDVTLQDKL